MTLRECREALDFSQAAFAAELGVSPETHRVWDSGRRPVLAPLAVGGVNVSPCKNGVYATFGTQQRSQAPLGL